MAIQNRRGSYSSLIPQRLSDGEWAVVTSGDPNAADGKAVYMCFVAGNVKRMATYEDMLENVRQSCGVAIAEQIATACDAAIKSCQAATSAANTAKANADKAVTSANAATSAANTAKSNADSATKRAIEAAEAAEGVLDVQRLTDLEIKMESIIETLKNVLSIGGE